MRMTVILSLIASVVAAPCIYEVASTEPSPLAGLAIMVMAY